MAVQLRGGGDGKYMRCRGSGKMTTSTWMTQGTRTTTMHHSKVHSTALFCSKRSLLVVYLRLVVWFLLHLYIPFHFFTSFEMIMRSNAFVIAFPS
jgi:hypothetical protein